MNIHHIRPSMDLVHVVLCFGVRCQLPKHVRVHWYHAYVFVCASCWFYKMNYISLHGMNNIKQLHLCHQFVCSWTQNNHPAYRNLECNCILYDLLFISAVNVHSCRYCCKDASVAQIICIKWQNDHWLMNWHQCWMVQLCH